MSKIYKYSILLIFLSFLHNSIYGQDDKQAFCGFDAVFSKSKKSIQDFIQKTKQFEVSYQRYIKENIDTRDNPSFVLPVVVHIIHNGGDENISDARVMKGIDNLNEAFANTGYYNQNTGVTTGIQFCLAQRDPDGKATTGINRIQSSLTNMDINNDDGKLKQLIQWDPYHYINIWLVKDICRGSKCSVVGYAYFPSAHGSKIDGLVVEAKYFGGSKSSAIVQIHEMGHYLGLFHTFQGGCKNDNCLTDGDKVCDTPPDGTTAGVPCGTDVNSCTTDVLSGFNTDQNDMYWDYMDYGNFRCMSAFTEGQRKRMVFAIQNIRHSLLESKACLSPCNENITANFSLSRDTFYLGENITITNTSSGNATKFRWLLNGNEISTSKNLTYQFTAPGTFSLKLEVLNAAETCQDFISKNIVVLCPAAVHIKVSNTQVLSGDNVRFEAQTFNADSYKWYIDGNFVANTKDFDYIFNDDGTKTIKVIATNSQWNCSDTATIKIIVTCPVLTNFKPSGFFPNTGEIIHFTNTSINANTYTWTIDDQNISNNKDMDYRFTSPGEYTVCLKATNGDCEKQFCVQIFVIDSTQSGCEDVYVKTIGDPGVDEMGYDLSFIDDNNIVIVGSYDNQSLLFTVNENLKVISSEKMNFLQSDEYIYNSLIDKNGYLLFSGVGFNTSNGRSAFIAKYDLKNKNLIWKKKIEDSKLNNPIFWTINQLSTGNYIIGGKTYIKYNDCDALIMELDEHNGDILWHRTFDAGSCDGFLKLLEINNFIYGTGRFALSGGNQNKFRAILTKMTKNGKPLWKKNLLFKLSKNARIYSSNMIDDNGIVIIMLGDEEGNNLDNCKIQVAKTDYEGSVIWSKGFHVDNTYFNRVKKIINFPDGYLIAGDYKYDLNNREVLLFKIDKSGNLLWKKSYKIGKSSEINSLKYKNGYLYLLGTSTNGNDKNIFLLKLTVDGNLPEDCHNIISIPLLNKKNIPEFIESIIFTESTTDVSYFNSEYFHSSVDLNENDICKKECFDSCSVVPDATSLIVDAQCHLDSFVINFKICNYGNVTLPANTPVTFYDADPLLHNANIIKTYYLSDSIKPGLCKIFSTVIKAPLSNKIYLFANDNGTTVRPVVPKDDLPNSGILECTWDNNLSAYNLSNARTKILDLGKDTVMCSAGVVILNAGSGFVSYKWNDGTTDSIYTAWTPGKHWVEVKDECGNIQRDTVNITVDPGSILDLGDDMELCPGEEVTWNISGFKNIEWYINGKLIKTCTGSCEFTLIPDSSVNIHAVAINDRGCISSDSISISLFQGIDISLPRDTTIELGDKILIIPISVSPGKYKYRWQPPEGLSCTSCFNPEASPVVTTQYTLETTDDHGCFTLDTILIKVRKKIIIDIPNIFTPNGDGINDVFYVKGKKKGIKQVLTFKIFDRWGELVFEDKNFQINDPLHGWDGTFRGKKVNPGVFVYFIKIEILDNTVLSKAGDVTVLK